MESPSPETWKIVFTAATLLLCGGNLWLLRLYRRGIAPGALARCWKLFFACAAMHVVGLFSLYALPMDFGQNVAVYCAWISVTVLFPFALIWSYSRFPSEWGRQKQQERRRASL